MDFSISMTYEYENIICETLFPITSEFSTHFEFKFYFRKLQTEEFILASHTKDLVNHSTNIFIVVQITCTNFFQSEVFFSRLGTLSVQ